MTKEKAKNATILLIGIWYLGLFYDNDFCSHLSTNVVKIAQAAAL